MPTFRVCLCVFLLMNSPTAASPNSTEQQDQAQKADSSQKKAKEQTQTNGANSAKSGSGAVGDAKDKQAQEQKKAAFQSRLARIFDPNNEDLSDYVPCHFTVEELLRLRPAPPTPRLTGYEAEALKQQVETEALTQEQEGALEADSRTEFVMSVARADLEGLTPSAALATIISLFRAADKAGAARKNPASIRDVYSSNPLLGLAMLASVAPDWGPIGDAWAEDASLQAYNQGVRAGISQGLSASKAQELFQSLVSRDFQEALAKQPPKEALKQINGELTRIQQEEKTEVTDLSAKTRSLPSALDPGQAEAAVARAAKTVEDATANLQAAKKALQDVTAADAEARKQLDAAKQEASLAEKAMQTAGTDPTVVKPLAEAQQRAKVGVVSAQQRFDAVEQQLRTAQKEVEQRFGDQDAAAKAQQEAQKEFADAKVPQQLKEAKKGVAAAAAAGKAAAAASQPPTPGAAAQGIVDSARSAIGLFKRPPDIGCAMSILSWNETRYEYGRLLANEYIGVQVVVRNLSETQEFVLHDSAFAVDADLTGRKGRFFSGRDKLIVRGMSAADADFSPRNIVVHMMEAVGTIMSAVIPIAGTSFSSASSVYNSGFLQGVHKTWTDHNTDHLNLLNDTAFSSATAYKTVVPKSGSVMFVMFIPAKQFEQGWWAQQCAQTISNGILPNADGPDGSEAEKQRRAGDAASAEPASPQTKRMRPEDQVGIDLERARAACKYGGGEAVGEATGEAEAQRALVSKPTPFKVIPYKHWPGNALSIFRELAFTIVSGVHVNEAAQNKPGISAVDCKEDTEGNVDFNEQSGGNLSCPVKGQNLDKVQKLRLRNSADATDSKVAEGDVKVNGDSTTATVTFPLAQIGILEGAAYKVFLVNKDGVESVGGQTLHFARTPFVAPPTLNPIPIDLGKDLDAKTLQKTVELSGYHLDKISRIHLISADTLALTLDFTVDKPTATKASFVFDASKNKQDLGKVKTLNIKFDTTDTAHPTVESKTTISISGAIPAATPATPPAPSGTGPGDGADAKKPGAGGQKPQLGR